MKKRKFLSACLALLILLQLFAGCSRGYTYFWGDAKEWFNKDFRKNNIVTIGFLGESREYPANRTIVIDTQEEYDRAFVPNIPEFTVDFSKQMIAVYTFVDTNRRENILTDVRVENGVLKLICEDIPPYSESVDYGDTCQPYQRWYVVILDKVDVHSVVFERI